MYYFHSPKTVLGEPDTRDIVVMLFLKHELNTLCLCKVRAISFLIPWLARTSENYIRAICKKLPNGMCFVCCRLTDRFAEILANFSQSSLEANFF